jgi:iron(III) transport system ATP-binding protein
MANDSQLRLEGVSKRFSSSERPAVERASLEVAEGCFATLLGPSGCGKTTLLRLIAGFERPDEGRILLAGRQVAGGGAWVPPERRGVGMVFQDYALFPHLTVLQNVAFGLKYSIPAGRGASKRASHVIELVGLRGFEDRFPHELSGGQQQRVAVARALAPKPQLILMDEPLSNLDAQLRVRLRQELRAILGSEGVTGLLVTHDLEEALSLADLVAVMQDGRIEQAGSPETLCESPATRFVAEFVTQANFLPARRVPEGILTEIGLLAAPPCRCAPSGAGEVMIRQEDLLMRPSEDGQAIIAEREFLGREYSYRIRTGSGMLLRARTPVSNGLQPGTRVSLSASPERLRLFRREANGG